MGAYNEVENATKQFFFVNDQSNFVELMLRGSEVVLVELVWLSIRIISASRMECPTSIVLYILIDISFDPLLSSL